MVEKFVSLDEIINFCCEYLDCKSFTDYCVDGLQIEGSNKISRIVTGVSWSQKLVQYAIDTQAEMVFVHHGLFGNMLGDAPLLSIKGYMKGRLAQLLTHNINLAGFHLPLDAHPEIGNNASLCRLFSIENIEKFDVGFIGTRKGEVTIDDFVFEVNKKLSAKSAVVYGGNKQVKRVAIISGGASGDFLAASELGADTFICGDLREDVVRAAEEQGISIIAAGHYNTEKLGIQNLGKLVSDKFGVESEFFDVPCEI